MITAFSMAQRFVGLKEAPGSTSNPLVLGMLQLDSGAAEGDDVPWCSAFVNFIAHVAAVPRSRSLSARSWLSVGKMITLNQAEAGWDVVILKRGLGVQPGPDVLNAPGHVGFYAGHDDQFVHLLGGNQGNAVSVAAFSVDRILGIRRLI